MPPIRVIPRELQEPLINVSAKAGMPLGNAGFSVRTAVRSVLRRIDSRCETRLRANPQSDIIVKLPSELPVAHPDADIAPDYATDAKKKRRPKGIAVPDQLRN